MEVFMTAGNPPREHHFVTQSWIRRFADADGKHYSYDRASGEVKARSTKKIMKIFDLYTLDPDGIDDTSIETDDLQHIDDEGARTMSAILGGDRSEQAKESLADFFAAQFMRDPQRLFEFSRTAQRFLSHLFIEIFSTDSFAEFQMFFGDTVTEAEYDHILALGPTEAAREIARIQIDLDAPGGMEDLPFTDIIRSPDGRKTLRDTLLTLDWTLITAPPQSFVLGDYGLLFDVGNLGAGMRVPLSGSAALLLRPAKSVATSGILSRRAHDYEPASMNCESAARSRRWVAGPLKALELVKSQVTGDPLPQR
jgi:hypothetical protein